MVLKPHRCVLSGLNVDRYYTTYKRRSPLRIDLNTLLEHIRVGVKVNMVNINKESMRQDVFEIIYDSLKAKATNSSYGTSSQPTITASYVDSDEALPEIVIGRTNPDKEEPVFNRSNYTNNNILEINVYSKSNKDIDILSDNIDTFLHENKYQGITITSWDEEDDIYLSNENKIRSKTITINFKNRM